jgi:hypothetical protein
MVDKVNGSPSKSPSLQVDWEVYGAMLEASDMTDAQKREFIETIWSIVVSFVDLGFGVHPVQQVCGESISLNELLNGDVLSLPQSKSQAEFNNAANPQSGGAQERSPICNQPQKP